ncbi:MAG: TonB-dependent receptor [Bacteroidota bacterium]
MKQFLLLFSLFALSATIYQAEAQNTMQGTVVDDTNVPIADAYIYSRSGDTHSHTDVLGGFELKGSNIGDTITVSFLGFETQEFITTAADYQNPKKIVLQPAIFTLEQVSVSNALRAVNTVTDIDLSISPVNTSQEVLRTVPGLFIAQHAGGGKAEQIFLRGFDIDHGTDIAITVDGMPVNMVSHAHGQGYADLHFVIPETIDKVDFAKGPYYTEQGNFTTAGYVDFQTKDRLDNSLFGVEVGQFNTLRTLGMFDLLGQQNQNQSAYVATEYTQTDGPFESSQNFSRLNVMGKYHVDLNNGDRLSVILSHFQSEWDASGQIPQRLVDNGTITRFGAVDDTEGGQTSRTNVAVTYSHNIDNNTFVRANAFYSAYDFELFSNFTFFLEDQENGDQIRQFEDRRIFGMKTTVFHESTLGTADLFTQVGAGFRYDDVNNNELARTLNRRTTLEQFALGNVDETNLFGYADAQLDFGDFRLNAGIRVDAFNHNYNDQLPVAYSNVSEQTAIVSPKLNFIYNPNPQLQVFLKTGKGFHSNDTRVVVAQAAEEILPAAYGADLGIVWKPTPRVWISPALWYLYLEQEFVYVGDAAVVEPSGKTTRQGADLSVRVQLSDYLFLSGDVNYTHARSTEDPEGENFIPLAPDLTSVGRLSYKNPNGFSTSLQYRYVKDRPANEDNTIVAEGFFVTDWNATYSFNRVSLGLVIENIFDVDWNEAQFATESQLKDETTSVEELHFTPGVPFFVRGRVMYKF